MLGIRGSFLGFTFNGIHSSVFGITRTPSGSRFQKKLTPDLKSTSMEKPKNDGMYWYGSVYSKREFQVSFAFEEITEEQLKLISKYWNDKKIHPLIFDEEPYKVYYAKITGMASLKHLCFEKDSDTRVYRGEGNIVFTCFYPFAKSRFEYLEDYEIFNIPEWCTDLEHSLFSILLNGEQTSSITSEYTIEFVPQEGAMIEYIQDVTEQQGMMNAVAEIRAVDSEYVNISEWREASRIPSRKLCPEWSSTTKEYTIFNAGDLQIPFVLYFELPETNSEEMSLEITCENNKLKLEKILCKRKDLQLDKYLEINVETGTVLGCDNNFKRTGNLYNEYITEGDFFTLKTGWNYLFTSQKPVKHIIKYLYL